MNPTNYINTLQHFIQHLSYHFQHTHVHTHTHNCTHIGKAFRVLRRKEEDMLTRRLEVSGWKRKELCISRQTELARWNIQLDETG